MDIYIYIKTVLKTTFTSILCRKPVCDMKAFCPSLHGMCFYFLY